MSKSFGRRQPQPGVRAFRLCLLGLAGCSLLASSCGPEDLGPTAKVAPQLGLTVDPEARVPFGAAPDEGRPEIVESAGVLTVTLANGSLAKGWQLLGEKQAELYLLQEATRSTLTAQTPSGYERLGVRTVRDGWVGPVVWLGAAAGGAGSGAQGLSPAPELFFLTQPGDGPTLLALRSASISLSLFPSPGGAPTGHAQLLLRALQPTPKISLLLNGTVSAVTDAQNAAMTYTARASGVDIALPAPLAAGDSLTLNLDFELSEALVEAGGRVHGGLDGDLYFAGDGVAWFPRPDDLADPEASYDFSLEVPAGYLAFAAGGKPIEEQAAPGRVRFRQQLARRVGAWPVLAAGKLKQEPADATGSLVLAARSSGSASALAEHAQEAGQVLGLYTQLMGPLPGGFVAMVEVPDSFRVGYSGPSLALIPTVNFDKAPSTWSRFLISHELSHAWWGHGIFMGDYLELWLIEGMADYSAARALELLADSAAATKHAQEDLTLLLKLVAEGYGGQPGRDTPIRPDRLGDLQDYIYYVKGAWMLRHLEGVLGRRVFDAGLLAYASRSLGRDGTSPLFQQALEQAAGRPLAWFFDQWLAARGFPKLSYELYWQESLKGAEDLRFGIRARGGVGGDPSVPFLLPLDLQLEVGDPANPSSNVAARVCAAGAGELLAPATAPCSF